MNDLEYDFDDSLSQNSDNAFQGNDIVQSEDGTQNPEQKIWRSQTPIDISLIKLRARRKNIGKGRELVIRTSLNIRRILLLVRIGNVNT